MLRTWTLQQETVKSIAFLILDIIMMAAFTIFWFSKIHYDERPVRESLKFTAAMTTFFFTYYFIFDYLWNIYR